MKCNKCNSSAIYGSGTTARCYNHLDESLKGTDYRDYHTPAPAKKPKLGPLRNEVDMLDSMVMRTLLYCAYNQNHMRGRGC